MNPLIVATDVLEKIILLALLFLSVWSVSIMVDRRRLFKKEFQPETFANLQKKMESSSSKGAFLSALSHNDFLNRVLSKALRQSSDAATFEKAVSGTVKAEKLQFEKGLAVLGTLGANAPFIGLFGTVLGIIRAFAYLGTQSGSSAVMSGVSQALYATALGLLVAIPAVVANNYFANRLKNSIQSCESLRDELIARKMV